MLTFFKKQKKWFRRPRVLLLAAVLVAVAAVAYAAGLGKPQDAASDGETVKAISVQVAKVAELTSEQELSVSGVVKPATQVDVVALANGTIRQLGVAAGSAVVAGQFVAELFDATAVTNLNNATVNFSNTQLSAETAKSLAQESVRQSEVGVQNAQEAVESARIGLQTAENNLANTLEVQKQEKDNGLANAVIAVQDYLNASNKALTQINFIIKAEGNSQLPGIAPTLGVVDPQSLPNAKDEYRRTKDSYTTAKAKAYSKTTIKQDLTTIVGLLHQTLAAIDATITTLDNTVVSLTFSDADLLAQKNAFAALRSSTAGTLTAAQQTQQSLTNIDLVHKQQRDSLTNAVSSAKSQLALTELSLSSAELMLEQARLGYNQQVVSSQSSLDTSRGQLQLVQTQIADLTATTPIAGNVTKTYVEVGDEVMIGTPLVQISQSNLVTIELELTSEEVYDIQLGQSVLINTELEGAVTHIDPTADPVTRKVGIEVVFDNSKNDLIPETFVSVTIPLATTGSDNKLLVPLRSVNITQSERYVFVLDDTTAKKTLVTIGEIVGDQIEITSGLEDTDTLIIGGNRLVEDGAEVVVTN